MEAAQKNKSISVSSTTSNNAPNVDYSGLIEKMKFYEDPILYSSDDESRKNTNYGGSQSNQEYSSSVNLSSEG